MNDSRAPTQIDLDFSGWLAESDKLAESEAPFVDALSDELGIDTDQIQNSPQWVPMPGITAGKISFGGNVVSSRWVKNAEGKVMGAFIRTIDRQKGMYQRDGKWAKLPRDTAPNAEVFVSLAELEKMQRSGTDPTGGMGGMPPM